MADNWQLKAVLSAVDKMSPVLKNVATVAKSTRKYLLDVGNSAAGLSAKIGLPFAALSGVMGGFSLVAIKNAVTGFTEMGEEVYKASLRTGMTVEELQRMKYVSEQAGVPVEGLQLGMAKLNKQMGDASAGKNKDLAGLFHKLKIDMRDANGQLRSGIDILPQMADAFVRNKNPVVQARMGMAAFGKSWQELVPLLMEGSDGIAASLQRFAKFKGVLSLEDIKGAKELGDKFKDLQFVTKGFQNTIAKELVPVLGPLIEDLIQWGAANRKLVTAGVKEFVRDLVQGLREIDWQGVIQGAKNFGHAIGTMVDGVGGARNALILLAIVINAQTLMALGGLIASVGRATWAFVAMAAQAYVAGNASLLSLGRIAAMATVLGGPLGLVRAGFAWVAGAAASAGGIISGAMGLVGMAIRGIGAALMANPLGIILGIATAAYLIYQNWDTLKGWFSGFFSWIGEKFHSVADFLGLAAVADLIAQSWSVLKDWFSGFFDWIGEKFQSLIGWAVDLAKSVAGLFGPGAGAGAGANNGRPQSDAPASASRPSLVAPAARVNASGTILVSFKDAPPGTRIEQRGGGDVPISTDVGYRSYAMGMP